MISPTSAKNVFRMIYIPSIHYAPDYHLGSPRQQGWFFTQIPQALSPSSEAVLLFLSTWLFTHRWQNLGGTEHDVLLPSTLSRFSLIQSCNSDESNSCYTVLFLLSTIMAEIWQGLYSSNWLDLGTEIWP